MRIEAAESPELLGMTRELFVEYSKAAEVQLFLDHLRRKFGDAASGAAARAGINFCFQEFADEVGGLPGEYRTPKGRLFVAFAGEQPAGCVALRPVQEGLCEMKRLYVRPAFRDKGIGAKLIFELIQAAREIGYQRMRLDTLPSMQKAIALYRSTGFREIAPSRPNPIPGALFFELELGQICAR